MLNYFKFFFKQWTIFSQLVVSKFLMCLLYRISDPVPHPPDPRTLSNTTYSTCQIYCQANCPISVRPIG
jgi:hypothetical protein